MGAKKGNVCEMQQKMNEFEGGATENDYLAEIETDIEANHALEGKVLAISSFEFTDNRTGEVREVPLYRIQTSPGEIAVIKGWHARLSQAMEGKQAGDRVRIEKGEKTQNKDGQPVWPYVVRTRKTPFSWEKNA